MENKLNSAHYITSLGLEPHPEGGYFRQLFGNDESGKKDISTIYYMLTANDISAFHRLHDVVIDTEGKLSVHSLSPESEMQVIIQPEQWFAAEIPSKQGFSLVGCAVAPAFTFENFELADKKELLKQFPQHSKLIERMCK